MGAGPIQLAVAKSHWYDPAPAPPVTTTVRTQFVGLKPQQDCSQGVFWQTPEQQYSPTWQQEP